jgi:hypothetical protein
MVGARLVRLGPRRDLLQPLERLVEGGVGELLAARVRIPRANQIAQPQLPPVEAKLGGDVVHVPLEREDHVRAADAAERAGGRGVRIDNARLVPDAADPVGRGVDELRDRADRRRLAGVGACVHEARRLLPQDLAVAAHGRPDAHDRILAWRTAGELLLPGVDELDRPAGLAREQGAVGLEARVELAAEPAADRGRDHAHGRRPHAEDVSDAVAHVERVLGRGVDDVAAALVSRDGAARLDRELVLAGRLELVLDDEVGARERVLDVAPRQARRPRHVAFARPFDDRRIGPPLGVDQPRGGRKRRLEVGHRLQRFQLDLDGARPGIRLLEGLRGDGGDRLAGVAHDVPRQQRLVLDEPAGDPRGVRRRRDRVDTRQQLRATRVHLNDPRRCERRAHEPPVQHPRLLVIDAVDRGSPHLGITVAAAHVLPDDRARHGVRVPPAASAASTILW